MRSGRTTNAAGRTTRFRCRHHEPFYADHPWRFTLPGARGYWAGTRISAGAALAVAAVSASGPSHAISSTAGWEQSPQRSGGSHGIMALSKIGKRSPPRWPGDHRAGQTGKIARCRKKVFDFQLRRRTVRISGASGGGMAGGSDRGRCRCPQSYAGAGGETRNGHATGVLLRDQRSGKEERVEARWIVNATGPWADAICQSSSIQTGNPMVGGVRGSHIVLPRFAGAPAAAVYTEALDGRPVFVIPWNEQVLVGTTEVPDRNDPGRTQPSAGEIDYLLQSLKRLFPRLKISQDDIHYAFAGVRPLPFSPDKNPAAISRKHYLHDHTADGAAQMISVIGGKLTTAGSLARECTAKIGVKSAQSTLALASENNVDPMLEQWVAKIAEAGDIDRETAGGIAEWYGKRALTLARTVRGSAEMRARLCPHTCHIAAEAVDAFTTECAGTLADVLLRRVPVALGACWSSSCSREAATRIAAVMQWSEERAAMELETFERERQAFLKTASQVEAIRETEHSS